MPGNAHKIIFSCAYNIFVVQNSVVETHHYIDERGPAKYDGITSHLLINLDWNSTTKNEYMDFLLVNYIGLYSRQKQFICKS